MRLEHLLSGVYVVNDVYNKVLKRHHHKNLFVLRVVVYLKYRLKEKKEAEPKGKVERQSYSSVG